MLNPSSDASQWHNIWNFLIPKKKKFTYSVEPTIYIWHSVEKDVEGIRY